MHARTHARTHARVVCTLALGLKLVDDICLGTCPYTGPHKCLMQTQLSGIGPGKSLMSLKDIFGHYTKQTTFGLPVQVVAGPNTSKITTKVSFDL